jgi:thiamine-phosphate pyrophosphorylase
MNKKGVLKGLYGITDSNLLGNTEKLLTGVEAAFKGGMKMVQYRAKNLPLKQQLEQIQLLKQLCRKYNALFIINDDVKLAQQVNADGIHLGQDDIDVLTAREMLGPQAIIGCSCYNQLELGQRAQQQGADYVAFGRFFLSETKPEAVQADPFLMQQARALFDIPVCVIGGITSDNASALIQQGADMVAVIHDLFSAGDIQQQARRFSQLFD